MKILHINTGQTGGAAWCARRINNALTQEGIESRMLFAEGPDMPQGIEGAIAESDPEFWYSNAFLGKVKHLLNRMPWYYDEEKMKFLLNELNTEKLYLHHPFSHYKNIAHHPLVEWADVIHLHWVPDFVDYPTFFKEVKKPIVWTLHDKYPAEGIQHYNSEFFPVPEALKDVDRLCRKIKRKGVLKAQNLHIVAISEQMQLTCHDSDVLKGFPCTLIHNGVVIAAFTPHDKQESRKVLNKEYGCEELREENAKVFMFSAFGIWDNNKGLQRIIDALEQVECPNKMLIVVGQKGKGEDPHASFPIITTGLVKDQTMLSQLYSAADFFIQASYEESFGQTPLEAMACGTPVISTPVGISPDLIRPFNGVICPGYTPESLKAGIEQALSATYDRDAIRAHVVAEYNYSKIAKEYIALYEKIVGDHRNK